LNLKVSKEKIQANTNQDKGCILAKGFFPAKPSIDSTLASCTYLPECKSVGTITAEQIHVQLKKLKPYKAPGPDSILNIVLTKSTNLIIERLMHIYQAMFKGRLMYKPWKEFVTVVLRKPGKPRYNTPKAYRPIALLNIIWKVVTAIIANHITYIMEKHQLLPANHFGGRPEHTTANAMHLLTNKVKAAWRAGKVIAILFLDIEGAFLNANLEWLVHNLRKWRVLAVYTKFVHNMLRD